MSDPELSNQRRHLLERIHRRFQTVSETVDLAGMQFLFTRIADPDRVLDEVAEEESRLHKLSGQRPHEDLLHLPYWAELWDSAPGIGAYLIRQGLPAGASILDLGCGMGLSGTVAAALGADVLFADLEPPALLFARLNSLPWRQRVRTRPLNWRTERLDERFDLILGADILYERKQWEHLEPFWRSHLKPGGAVLLGEPGRMTGDLFPEWIEPKQWRLERFEQPVSTRPKPIRLFRIRPM